MLRALGLERVEQLFEEQIPAALLLDRPLDMPPGMSEIELRRRFQDAGRAQPARGRAALLPRRRHLRPLRPERGRPR